MTSEQCTDVRTYCFIITKTHKIRLILLCHNIKLIYSDFILKEAVKIMAKDLVRTRNFIKKFYLMKANLQAVSLKIQVSPTHL